MKVSTKKTPVKSPAIALLLMSLVVGCGNSADQFLVGSDEQSATEAENIRSNELIAIPISVSNRDLALTADAGDWKVDIASCASGYNPTDLTKSGDVDVELYKHDAGCIAQPTQVTYSGIDYNYLSGFSSYANGETATFREDGGSREIVVEVVSQLPATISTGVTIEFLFYDINQASNYAIEEAEVSDAHAIAFTGDSAPDLALVDDGATVPVQLISMTAGVPKFTFNFECGVGTASNQCGEHKFSDISVKLVDASIYGDPMTYVEAEGLSGFSAVSEVPAGGAHNGGFAVSLDGPGLANDYPDMYLVIAHDKGKKSGGDPDANSSYLVQPISLSIQQN